jgi:hypothetical protein
MSRAILRPAVLCVLVCLLAVSFASAAPARNEPGVRETAGVAQAVRAILPELWSSLRSLFLEEGSSLDPSGGATTDAGSSLDPNGGATTDAGSSLDPNG